MVSTQLPSEVVHPDTQVVLLLCGAFARGGGPEAKPLTSSEYNGLASWLCRQGKRPASLLQTREGPFATGEPGLPSADRIRALLGRGFQMAAALEGWHRLGLWVISRGEDSYPERLRRQLRSAAPPLLYGAGDRARLNQGGIAMVGSRDVEEEGLSFTRRVAERCAGQGVQIISGGARGVDRTAVAAALEAGGGAIAVLADRLDRTATSRDAKEPIRRGQLTLVTPYEPESGFTVGKAMGRNKHIYALADHALVVCFTTGAGGTWAGATEQLSRNKVGAACVPLFIRRANTPQDGYAELHSRGALPFPEEDFWESNVVEVLSRTASRPEQSQTLPACDSATAPPATNGNTATGVEQSDPQATTPSRPEGAAPPPSSASVTTPPAVSEADTCYMRCLPLLLLHLRQEVDNKHLSEIAERLDLMPSQLQKWLKRAEGEGKIRRKKKKGRVVYVDASLQEEQILFDRGGDAA